MISTPWKLVTPMLIGRMSRTAAQELNDKTFLLILSASAKMKMESGRLSAIKTRKESS